MTWPWKPHVPPPSEPARELPVTSPAPPLGWSEEAVLGFLETCLVAHPAPRPRSGPSELMALTFELASADWTMAEAAAELALVAQDAEASLDRVHRRLTLALLGTQVYDPVMVRASRVVRGALGLLRERSGS